MPGSSVRKSEFLKDSSLLGRFPTQKPASVGPRPTSWPERGDGALMGWTLPASGESPHLKGIGPLEAETFPMQPTIIGLDLAKTVFQVHGVDAAGKIVFTKRLRRDGVNRSGFPGGPIF